jgi:hypothetical protein
MTRPASLDRLREISRQRTIRRPLLIPVPNEPEDQRQDRVAKVEWPVRS